MLEQLSIKSLLREREIITGLIKSEKKMHEAFKSKTMKYSVKTNISTRIATVLE
jgi:hypothetical protein